MLDPSRPAEGGSRPVAVEGEDAKLVTLARATRARTGAEEGAAVRDSTGRTYTAGPVRLRAWRLSALQAAIAAAVASGADALEAAAVVSAAEVADEPALGELKCSALLIADFSGRITAVRPCPSGGAAP